MARLTIEMEIKKQIEILSCLCEYQSQCLDRKDVSLHIELQPGGRMYVDLAGSKMQIN